jgi:energy-coupling factor transporter ATP-binding protein EcfA2
MLPLSPYSGLRPFNEEENIFFKGREQQVEPIVKRLEEKKFLMVNGASGDGKSSLIFAKVIPSVETSL